MTDTAPPRQHCPFGYDVSSVLDCWERHGECPCGYDLTLYVIGEIDAQVQHVVQHWQRRGLTLDGERRILPRFNGVDEVGGDKSPDQ